MRLVSLRLYWVNTWRIVSGILKKSNYCPNLGPLIHLSASVQCRDGVESRREAKTWSVPDIFSLFSWCFPRHLFVTCLSTSELSASSVRNHRNIYLKKRAASTAFGSFAITSSFFTAGFKFNIANSLSQFGASQASWRHKSLDAGR